MNIGCGQELYGRAKWFILLWGGSKNLLSPIKIERISTRQSVAMHLQYSSQGFAV